MLTLGALNGISLVFDETGSLARINIHRHGKVLSMADGLSTRIVKPGRPGPVFSDDDFPAAKEFALESFGRRLVQELAGGQRTWEVYQSRADARDAALAWGRLSYSLDAATEWRLSLNDCVASVQQSDNRVTIQCGNHLALRVNSQQPMTYETSSVKGQITGTTVVVQLPQGESQVELVVESRPQYNVADTVVLCLPQQLCEAAVVATCVRGKPANQGKVVPVIDVMNPPLGPDEFKTASQGMQATVQELQQVDEELRRLTTATPATSAPELILPGGSVARSEDKVKDLAKHRQELQQQVSEQQAKVVSYAAWQRRWERVLRLINSLQPTQVVSLYPLPPDLLAAIPPQAQRVLFFWEDFREQVQEWEKALAAKTPGRPATLIYFRDLEELSRLAWERLTGQAFQGAFTIPDDPRYYALGVRRALQLGKPLLPKGRAGQRVNLEAATEQVNQAATADEAVIVEADGTLASLAAALYADYLNAPLFVHPASNPQDVLRNLSAIQQSIEKEELAKQSSTAYAYIGEHKSKFMQDPKVPPEVRNLAATIPVIELPRAMPTPYSPQVFMQMLATYTNAREQGVEAGYRYDQTTWEKDTYDLTTVVTARVEGLVRAKMLKRQRATVFTVGIPYTFVDGWRDKTVSHVLVEPCLTLLRHVMSAALRPPLASFTAVFDSGVLRPMESPEVNRRLRHGSTYPLYLRERTANAGALQTYPSLLPIEGIFLDTLGDESSIFLSDQRRGLRPFSAPEIELTCELAYSPLVFSHIAFSWLSVGAAFMVAGARGYVGTLWSVESEPAQEVALRILGDPDAVSGVAVDEMTRRAYIRLGLLAAQEPPAGVAEPGGELPNAAAREVLYSAMLFLAQAGLYEQAEPLFRRWESLAREDLAAAGDDAGLLKDELDALEREYHRREQMGREKRANGEAVPPADDLAGVAPLGTEPPPAAPPAFFVP